MGVQSWEEFRPFQGRAFVGRWGGRPGDSARVAGPVEHDMSRWVKAGEQQGGGGRGFLERGRVGQEGDLPGH